MNDRELLELAAKAARLDAEWHSEDGAVQEAATEGMYLKGARSVDNSQYWNPLTNDGDAFRLVVDLGLKVEVWDWKVTHVYGLDGIAYVQHHDDPRSATRRAITQVAAQTGKEMP